MPLRKEPTIPNATIDQLLSGADPKKVFDPDGLLGGPEEGPGGTAAERRVDHITSPARWPATACNGYGRKTVADSGELDLNIPRDRKATFDPQLTAKYRRRFPSFDDKIVSMYARGMSTCEITGHLKEIYGFDVLRIKIRDGEAQRRSRQNMPMA